MSLQEQIINFCIENIVSITLLAFVGTIATIIGYKEEWEEITWILGIITLPFLIIFVIWVIVFVTPFILDSLKSIFGY